MIAQSDGCGTAVEPLVYDAVNLERRNLLAQSHIRTLLFVHGLFSVCPMLLAFNPEHLFRLYAGPQDEASRGRNLLSSQRWLSPEPSLYCADLRPIVELLCAPQEQERWTLRV